MVRKVRSILEGDFVSIGGYFLFFYTVNRFMQDVKHAVKLLDWKFVWPEIDYARE